MHPNRYWSAFRGIAAASLLISLSACSHKGDPATPTTASAATRVFDVSVRPVGSTESAVSLAVSGNLVEEQNSPVTVISGGRVLAAPATVGAYVEKGAVLLEIDPTEYQARAQQARAAAIQSELALKQAESRLFQQAGKPFDPDMQPSVLTAKDSYQSATEQNDIAKRNLDRYQQLLKTGDVARYQVDQIAQQATQAKGALASAFIQYEGERRAARNNYESLDSSRESNKAAQSQLKIAEANVAACTVRAPVSGFVASRAYGVGDFANTGTPGAVIITINPILLNARIPEGQEQKVRTGLAAVVRVPSWPEKTFTGVVQGINPSLDPASRAVIARVSIPNPNSVLRPGMFGTAEIQLATKEPAIFVPTSAIVPGVNESSPIIFVLDGNNARARVVRLGEETSGQRRVFTGLTAQDRVIVEGARELFDGAAVRVK
jgi:multidrug efflux pump subunit AcrA (membrane-fusion protein)